MRKIIKNLLALLLAYLSGRILKKYKPKIIGITGSIGKTSAKEAIFLVVSQKYRIWKSEKNFNTEFGLPYAVFGIKEDPGKNFFKWLKLLLTGLSLIFLPHKYAEILVLEMGVDRPGDMDYLLSIAKPDISVITGISVSHYEFFKTPEAIAKEKGKIAEILGQEGILILNADNANALRQADKTKAKVLRYGTSQNAEISLKGVKEEFGIKPKSNLQVITPQGEIDLKINALGAPHLSAVLSAVCVATALKIEKDLIVKGMQEYKPFLGRLNIIAGIKHTIIIDDTYNSAPDSAKEALRLLGDFPALRKFAVLGDMLELGELSHDAHRELGKFVVSLNLSYLLTVGQGGAIIAEGAKEGGMSTDRIINFASATEVSAGLAKLLLPESVILIKGSQGMRMEKITKEIMAEPMRASELLCRQYGKWLRV